MTFEKQTASSTFTIAYDYWIRKPENPVSLFLLLHGFSQRGESIFSKLEPSLPKNAVVLSLNAPFPSPVRIKDEYKEAYAWYFYMSKEKRFVIQPTESVAAIHKLLKDLKLNTLPINIIGFSQGGYMVPWLVKELATVNRAITIAADYPSHYYENLRAYRFDAIHGTDDTVAPISEVRSSIQALVKTKRDVTFHEITKTGHEINDAVIERVKSIL